MFLNQRGKIDLMPEQLRAGGFPSLRVTFDLSGVALFGRVLDDTQSLIDFGGPPGGPSWFSLRLLRADAERGLPWVESLVRARDQPGQHFRLLGGGALAVAGRNLRGLVWSIKPTPWLDSRATLLLPLQQFRDALLLEFSAGFSTREGVTPHPAQMRLLKTLQIEEVRTIPASAASA